jgi:FdhD protein
MEPPSKIARHHALKWRSGKFAPIKDALAAEEPLEIRLGGKRFTLTMRTPGDDDELAAGFLFAEGIIASFAEIAEIRRVRGRRGEAEPNALDVLLNVRAERLRERLKRNFTINSSCGVCGKTSIEALTRRIAPIRARTRIDPDTLLALGGKLRGKQEVFAETGGLHACAIFDLEGNPVVAREDVGRHNAVDKAVGWALRQNLVPLAKSLLMVSGRLSFEIVQKAAAAGAPILAAVSAPSSLAVELADELGVTLVGFLRDSSFNAYTHRERIAP